MLGSEKLNNLHSLTELVIMCSSSPYILTIMPLCPIYTIFGPYYFINVLMEMFVLASSMVKLNFICNATLLLMQLNCL